MAAATAAGLDDYLDHMHHVLDQICDALTRARDAKHEQALLRLQRDTLAAISAARRGQYEPGAPWGGCR